MNFVLLVSIFIIMENDQVRKKVYMQTLSSTLINSKPTLKPKWSSQNKISFTSAYEFSTYNIQSQVTQLIHRNQNEPEILLVNFKEDNNDNHNHITYLFKQNDKYLLGRQPNDTQKYALVYKKVVERRSVIMENFLNSIIQNQHESVVSNHALLDRTQQLIEQIKEQRMEQPKQIYQAQILSIQDFKIINESNFALMLVQMPKFNGILLLDISRAQTQHEKNFDCPMYMVNLDQCQQNINEYNSLSTRIVYIFPQPIIQMHKTSDITQFVFLTQKNMLLIKINYNRMQLCILHKFKIGNMFKNRILSLGINKTDDGDYISALVQMGKQLSVKVLKSKAKKFIKLFKIEDKKIIEIKQKETYVNSLKYTAIQNKTLKFLDDCSEKTINIKFSDNILRSSYEIEDSEDENQFNSNVIINVFNSIVSFEQKQKQKAICQTEHSRKKLLNFETQQSNPRMSEQNTIKDIQGFTTNKNMIILWEKDQLIFHICKIVSPKQQQDRQQKHKQSLNSKTANKLLLKQKQMKDIYSQLMGNNNGHKQDNKKTYVPRLEYVRKIRLELPYSKINSISLSSNNYNLLIIGTNGIQARDNYFYSIFQLQLFSHLSNPDPNMFLKSIKNIYKNKPTEQINCSLIKEMPIFMTGNLIHTTQNQLIQGALCFDIHPFHLFMAVSFGFVAKIYSFEGSQRVNSLHTINLPGIKLLKYSPSGNHLCLLTSKTIKIIDSYSFMQKYCLHEKNSSFSKLIFSSNGLQFLTISQNSYINIYNTFDYSKIDIIKPAGMISDKKPIMAKSFFNEMHYLVVYQKGYLYVKHKPQAVVINHQNLYKYSDGENINCIEIDEKNGILFVGCQSGKLRAHMWPQRIDQSFDQYSEIIVGYNPIQSLTLSNINHLLYIGCANGNISKIKYLLDRDRGQSTFQQNPLFIDNSLKCLSMMGTSSIQKIYKYVLASSSNINEQLPQKIRLQYKLSEVINKLNEQMQKLKVQIRDQLQQKAKTSNQRLDLNLYHHMNRMITTKLQNQYIEEKQSNHKEMELQRRENQNELKNISAEQNQLIKQKSLLYSVYIKERNQVKKKYEDELSAYRQEQEQQFLKVERGFEESKQKTQLQFDHSFQFPNLIYDYEEENQKLIKQLQAQNKKYYQLRKQCAYKQTAIQGMCSKKIKQQTLQFKFDIEINEMKKKQAYSQDMISTFRKEICEAEQKVHQMQVQAAIFKTGTQFKKIAQLDEMNDACSYKLWTKEKIENQIVELEDHLRKIEELLDGKSSEMVDMIYSKREKLDIISQKTGQFLAHRNKLKMSKLNLLGSKNKIKRNDHTNQYTGIKSANTSPRNSRYSNSLTSRKNMTRAASTKRISHNNKDVQLFNSIMDKQMNFLKTTMKIHKRKIKNYGKQNGQLLTQFQKLKYENKNLTQRQVTHVKELKSIKKQIKEKNSIDPFRNTTKIDVHLVKTSFQKYLQNKAKDKDIGLKFKTTASTPSSICTPLGND